MQGPESLLGPLGSKCDACTDIETETETEIKVYVCVF